MTIKSMMLTLMILTVPTVVLACGGAGGCSCKGSCSDACMDTTSSSANQEVKIGNKICPVSGHAIDPQQMQPVEYVYKGKNYTLCCAGCISDFKSNPDKYSALAEAQMAKG